MDERIRRHLEAKAGLPLEACAMSLTIRTACTHDLPQVESLYRNLLQGPPHAQELPLEERLCEFFLVAEEEDRILGMLIAGPAPVDEVDRAMLPDMFPGCKRFLQIQELYVLPEYRSRGVGSALVREVIRRGRAAGLPDVMVYTDGTDEPGDDYFRRIRFYQRCGFRVFQTFLTQGPDSGTAPSAPVVTAATADTTSAGRSRAPSGSAPVDRDGGGCGRSCT